VSTYLQQLPEPLQTVRTRPLFVLHELVPPLLVVGATPNGFRRIGLVQGARSRAIGWPAKSARYFREQATGMCSELPVTRVRFGAV
jgi:hypothetical protein